MDDKELEQKITDFMNQLLQSKSMKEWDKQMFKFRLMFKDQYPIHYPDVNTLADFPDYDPISRLERRVLQFRFDYRHDWDDLDYQMLQRLFVLDNQNRKFDKLQREYEMRGKEADRRSYERATLTMMEPYPDDFGLEYNQFTQAGSAYRILMRLRYGDKIWSDLFEDT